jgi:hypothetical protein
MKWDRPDKTVIRYSGDGVWNWADFHRVMQVSHVNFDQVPGEQPIEAILDLSRTTKLPAGAVGHLRSLASRTHPRRTTRFIIIGVDAATQAAMGVQGGEYRLGATLLLFVADEAGARALLDPPPVG